MAKAGAGAACPPIELVAAFRDPAAATAKALSLILAYRDRGDAGRIAAKYTGQVSAKVSTKVPAPMPAKTKRGKASATGGSGHNKLVVVFDIDDTLLRDRATYFVLNPAVVQLHRLLVELGAEVYLVTARSNDAETKKWTVGQLAAMGIGGYAGLFLAPNSRRKSMTDVSRWKMEKRRDIGRAAGAPVVLTVGDQWGDMVTLSEDADIDALDAAFAPGLPWKVLRPHDGSSIWALKLKDYSGA